MKNIETRIHRALAVAALLLAGSSLSFADVLITNIFNTFDTAASGTGTEWGSSAVAWDGANGNPAGSLAINVNFSGSSDTPMTDYVCLGGGNPWYQPQKVNVSLYKTLEFDIKYDPTSDITIAQFNDLSTWPTTLTNSTGTNVFWSWAGAGYLAGSIGGIEVNLCGGPAGQMGPVIANTNIPAAAASGWTHVKIPINQGQSQIDGVNGVVFHKWIHQNWGIENPAVARLWIDNVMLIGTAAPPPPPTLSAPSKPTRGLNVFASTEGNTYYDRQEGVLRQNTGLSWVAHATALNPVTYSFTVAGYPNSVNCEAYMFLSPNPGGTEEAPDWNETNCAIAYVQGNANSATFRFRYKVNEPSQQAMYSGGNEGGRYYTNAPGSWDGVTPNYLESGNLGFVTNNGVLGTWTLKFTSDTNVTLIAPNGNTSSFIFPWYNIGYFAENSGFNAYLGMQANNADAMNQAVVYSSFAISNVAAPFGENFLADTVLDTTNTWNTSVAHGPKGVLIVPADASDWISWTLPDTGFGLQIASGLTSSWNDLTAGPVFSLYGKRAQLVSNTELPGANQGYFRLLERVFSQLQVLLPGETNAPGTLTGKTGTPDPTLSASTNTLVNVTINAVDAAWHIVNVSGDDIHLTTTAPTAITPLDAPLANGTLQQPVDYTGNQGSWTITATDTTNTNIPPATSSSFTVGP